MHRRAFTRLGVGALAAAVACNHRFRPAKTATHIVTLSFDDGFQKSFLKVAQLYEQDYFDGHLKGFRAADSVYNLPFNSSNPEIEAFLLSKVLAIRTAVPGITAHNPFPVKGLRKISCESYGEQNMDAWLGRKINDFLAADGGVGLHPARPPKQIASLLSGGWRLPICS